LQVEVREQEAGIVVVVSGELDLRSTPVLERELERVWQSGAKLVIFDLRAVKFMDSTGVRCVVLANRRAEQDGRRLAIAQGATQVRELLQRYGVTQLLAVADSPEELLSQAGGDGIAATEPNPARP
jgi:anti-anti-sigma factor